MKIFVLSFVLLSAICGLNGHCVRHQPGSKCEERVFPEPEPKEIHYIYTGESCNCPKYHDTIVEKPVIVKERTENVNYEYDIVAPVKQREDTTRYLFDVRVEKPVPRNPERSSSPVSYAIEVPRFAQENVQRYLFDTIVEKPVKPCHEKPWQGLVAQVDRVLMPARDCKNSEHSPETCNCGCRDPSHTPESCTCRRSGDYTLPISFNSRYGPITLESQVSQTFTFPDETNFPMTNEIVSTKSKRDVNSKKKLKPKRREFKLRPLNLLKKKVSKESKPVIVAGPIKKQKTNSKPVKTQIRQVRPKRKNESPCGYTYESCDPKKHNKQGCPLCYRCKCEPSNTPANEAKFSPYDFNVPYKFVSHDEGPHTAPQQQEFDDEPASYTGLKDRDMYKKYIQQIVAKYPEHMSRRLPDVREQQRDLMKFIDELAKADKSPGDNVSIEDVRYKLVDKTFDLYKYYERAMNKLPKISSGPRDGKYFKKRGTVLEVFEVDPEDYNDGSFKILDNEYEKNVSESQ